MGLKGGFLTIAEIQLPVADSVARLVIQNVIEKVCVNESSLNLSTK